MSDVKNVMQYLNEQNHSLTDMKYIGFAVLAISVTVIPLHTQKKKFLANRYYWLYFDNYRIKLNTNMIRDLLKLKHNDRTKLFKKYLKNNELEMINPDLSADYKPQTDKGGAWLASADGQQLTHPDLIKDRMKYMFIDNNASWYMEYCLMMLGIIASLYLVRYIIKRFGDFVYHTNEHTVVTNIFDILAGFQLLMLIYYVDQDYRMPSIINSTLNWIIVYIAIVVVLGTGHVAVRYIDPVKIALVYNNYPKLIYYGLIVIGILTLGYATVETMSWNPEKFTPSVIQHEEEEKTIQDLIDEQSRLI